MLKLILSLIAAGTIYAQVATVTVVDYDADKVYFTDTKGNIWVEYGVEDWQEGDLAALTMYDNGTDIIYDDVIVGARYNGSLSDFQKGE